MNVLGYISIYASTIYAATLILGASCSIGSDGTYVATKYQNYGMFAATTILTFGMTCVNSNTLHKLNMAYIFIQFAMLLGLIIALAAGTPSELKNSASFVFTDFENTGFWKSDGWAFMMCFLTPVWVVSGFESSATIAEEAANAAKAVPFAMVSSLVTAAITGWGVIITIAFCMGPDVIAIVESDLGQPLAQVAFNSLGKNGSIALLVLLWASSICNCSILMVAASRETFAFARGIFLPPRIDLPDVDFDSDIYPRSRPPIQRFPPRPLLKPNPSSSSRFRRRMCSDRRSPDVRQHHRHQLDLQPRYHGSLFRLLHAPRRTFTIRPFHSRSMVHGRQALVYLIRV